VLAKEGEQLFTTGKSMSGAPACASCHQILRNRSDLTTPIPLQISLFKPSPEHPNEPPGTDTTMACNAAMANSATGVMSQKPVGYVVPGPPMGATAPVASMLVTLAAGELWNKRDIVIETTLLSFIGANPPPTVVSPTAAPAAQVAPPTREQLCDRLPSAPILGYKARPLNGVWATAPFLHNGSIPTLYDLLLPPSQRPTSFWVGSREFDPVKVGYRSTPGPDSLFQFKTTDTSGRPIRGNSNAGHDYGNEAFTDHDRYALIEYLKAFREGDPP
jgi:hypothetical protein